MGNSNKVFCPGIQFVCLGQPGYLFSVRPERGVLHSQRIEKPLLHELLVGHSSDNFNDPRGCIDAFVGITVAGSRLKHQRLGGKA